MEIIKSEDFENTIKDGVVLVDFFANWCGPCKMLTPILEQVGEELGDKVKMVKVDVDESGDLAARYSIQAIPNLILFKDGKPVNHQVGYFGYEEALDFVKSAL